MTPTKLPIALALLLAGCRGNASREANPVVIDAGLPPVPAESLHLSDGMIRILREELTTKDPAFSMRAALCESIRLQLVYGENVANRLTAAAVATAHRGVADSTLRRIDAALATRTFRVGDNCDSLAKAGILGDTAFPPDPPAVR